MLFYLSIKYFYSSFLVVPAVKEPTEGWVDALTGPIGILVGGGKGVIRSMHCNGQYKACIIPVDFAINALIVIGWKIGSSKKRYYLNFNIKPN